MKPSKPTCNKSHMALLIGALRSGYFKQGYGSLRPTKDTWCFFGVACEVARSVDPTIGKWIYKQGALHFYSGGGSATQRLPPDVEAFYSITYDTLAEYEGEWSRLSGLNDHLKLTFEEIADVLERQFFSEEEQGT